jgi:2'-5' RNA ligase
MDYPDTKRLFLGIPLCFSIREELHAYVSERVSTRGVRMVQVENMHITLCFIGETQENHLQEVIDKTMDITRNTDSFTLKFKHLRPAPPGKKFKNMIWAEFVQSEDFSALSVRFMNELLKKQAKKQPIPHITLARSKTNLFDFHSSFNPEYETINVSTVALWKSELLKSGAQYTMLKQFPLQESQRS